MEKYLLNLFQLPFLYKLQQSFSGANDLKKKVMKSEIDFNKIKKVLDIGCGIGDTSLIFKDYDIQYFGIDLNKKRINYAKKYYSSPNNSFRSISVEDLADENLSFELVLCFGLIHHLKDSEISEFLNKIKSNNFEYEKIILLDPVKVPNQSILATILHKLDIGQNIKTEEEYISFFEDFNIKSEIIYSSKLKWAPSIKITLTN